MAVRYTADLVDLPSFASWLTTRVKTLQNAGQRVDDDVVQYSQPPERYATSHRQMHAFGMHLRIRTAELGLVTRDSGVVASFTRQLRWGLRNGQPLQRTEDYVGYIEEILELDYRNHCTTVLVCDWVRAGNDVRFPHVQRDRYGFAVANFNHMDSKVHANSFAFPLHVQQVFFSDDPHRRGWKVICRTDVRGRRGQLEDYQSIPSMVEVGNDEDFMGLQPIALESEPIREVATEGGMFITPANEAPRQQEADRI